MSFRLSWMLQSSSFKSMSDVTGAGMTVDDEDDAEMGRGVAAAIGGGVAGDVKLNGGDTNEDDDKTGMGWDSNDDKVEVEVGADNDDTIKGVSEDEKWIA